MIISVGDKSDKSNRILEIDVKLDVFLNDLDDDLSADLVREMTHIIIEKWEELTAEAHADKHIEVLV